MLQLHTKRTKNLPSHEAACDDTTNTINEIINLSFIITAG